MTALSLARILADELALVGVTAEATPRGRPRRTVFAPEPPGFGVREYGSGKRVYILQRRMGGRMRTLTIGNAAIVSHAVARDVARRVSARALAGEDVAQTRARIRATPSWERLIAEYWEKVAPRWKASTCEVNGVYRRMGLDAAFAGRFVDQIEHADAVKWVAAITRDIGPGAANKLRELARHAFNKAEQWGYRPEGSNPCTGIRPNRKRKFERFLSDAELHRLNGALDRLAERQPAHAGAIRLLVLTGCRKSEIIGLTFAQVHGQRLKLADSKTGPRTIWLGEEGRAVIDAQPRGKGDDRVFRLTAACDHSALQHYWRVVCADAGLVALRVHDLRHNYASLAVQSSETTAIVGTLLGHRSLATTARYAHMDERGLLEAADLIGGLIADAMA